LTFSFSFSQSSIATEATEAHQRQEVPKVIWRVRLLLGCNPNVPEVSEGEPVDAPEDGEMEVDELEDDDYVPVSNFFISLYSFSLATQPSESNPPKTSTAAAQATKSRKWKGTSLDNPMTTK
jgi:hypothetical protein